MNRQIEELQKELEHALHLFTDVDKMAGQVWTIRALIDFLCAGGFEWRLLAPLQSLHGDIVSAERDGSIKPLAEMAELVMAAVALDTLIKAGVKLVPAAEDIADAAGGAMSPGTLINFRKNLQRRRARAEAVDMYWDMVRQSNDEWGHLSEYERIREVLLSVHQSVVPAKKG